MNEVIDKIYDIKEDFSAIATDGSLGELEFKEHQAFLNGLENDGYYIPKFFLAPRNTRSFFRTMQGKGKS